MLQLKAVNFTTQQFKKYNLTPTSSNPQWSIGRNPDCDVMLDGPEISRIHGSITYSDDAYQFTDIGSTSGSILNGDRVQLEAAYALQVGDLLQLGETFIYIEEIESPEVSALGVTGDRLQTLGQWSNQDVWCRCDRIIQETQDVKTFCLVAEESMLFDYLPGQFVTLEVEIDGKSVLRPYSISSTPTRPYHLSVTIKRVEGGVVSNWMHDQFGVSDRLKLVGGAMGQFTCMPNLPEKMLLISAGSGITPMLSMSRMVQDTLVDSDIVFLHSAQKPEDIVCRSELETMAAQMPNFQLLVTLTKAKETAWMGLTGRISEAMLELTVPDWRWRSVYVCGPNGFMQHVRETLEGMGFPMEQYQEESFGGVPKAASRNAVSEPLKQTVTGNTPIDMAIAFKPSNHQAITDGSLSILEVAEQEGITIRSACRMGACGACKVKTCGTKVRYDVTPTALSGDDRETGHILACVAYPIESVEVHV
jgi:glycine betaine catabolism B